MGVRLYGPFSFVFIDVIIGPGFLNKFMKESLITNMTKFSGK